MAHGIALRSDFSATELRRLSRRSKDAAQARRLLALAAIHDGGTRSEAARLGNVTLWMVRDWVVRFNADGPAGLIDPKAAARIPLLSNAHRQGKRGDEARLPARWLSMVGLPGAGSFGPTLWSTLMTTRRVAGIAGLRF